MKLSKNSKQLMLFFTKNNHINKVKQTKQTNLIIAELYNHIYKAYKYLNENKKTGNYYYITTKKIISATQISKPHNFNSNSFPELVRKHIDELTMTEITYTFSLYNRNIKINFILEEDNIELKIETFNRYVDMIWIWLYILNQYASKTCANTLVICHLFIFYFT